MAVEWPQTMAMGPPLRRSPRPPQSGWLAIGAPRRSGKVPYKGKGCGRQQRTGQYAKHLEWPKRPPQAPPHHTSPRGPHATQHTHMRGGPRMTPVLPRLTMHAFTYDTPVWRGLKLKFLKQWGGDMIVLGRFRGALAAIVCHNSKSCAGRAKIVAQFKGMRRCAYLPFAVGMFILWLIHKTVIYEFLTSNALSSM
jgi:hypothetical protein